jgi:hypothetical protein
MTESQKLIEQEVDEIIRLFPVKGERMSTLYRRYLTIVLEEIYLHGESSGLKEGEKILNQHSI